MATKNDYKIENARIIYLNDQKIKIFKAYIIKKQKLFYNGEYTAPYNIPDDELWEYADEPMTGFLMMMKRT